MSDYYIDEESDRASLPAVGGDDYLRDKAASKKAELGVHFSRDFGARTSLELLAIQQAHHKTDLSHYVAVGDDEIFNETSNLAESIVRGVVRYQADSHLSFEVATEGAYNVQDTATTYLVNGLDLGLPAQVREVEKRGEFAASMTWSPSPQYTLDSGPTATSQAKARACSIPSRGWCSPGRRTRMTRFACARSARWDNWISGPSPPPLSSTPAGCISAILACCLRTSG